MTRLLCLFVMALVLVGCERDKDLGPGALAMEALHIPPGYNIVQMGNGDSGAWALLKNTTTGRLKLVTFGSSGHVDGAHDVIYDTVEGSNLQPVESK